MLTKKDDTGQDGNFVRSANRAKKKKSTQRCDTPWLVTLLQNL